MQHNIPKVLFYLLTRDYIPRPRSHTVDGVLCLLARGRLRNKIVGAPYTPDFNDWAFAGGPDVS